MTTGKIVREDRINLTIVPIMETAQTPITDGRIIVQTTAVPMEIMTEPVPVETTTGRGVAIMTDRVAMTTGRIVMTGKEITSTGKEAMTGLIIVPETITTGRRICTTPILNVIPTIIPAMQGRLTVP
jgi:hypothetical protein